MCWIYVSRLNERFCFFLVCRRLFCQWHSMQAQIISALRAYATDIVCVCVSVSLSVSKKAQFSKSIIVLMVFVLLADSSSYYLKKMYSFLNTCPPKIRARLKCATLCSFKSDFFENELWPWHSLRMLCAFLFKKRWKKNTISRERKMVFHLAVVTVTERVFFLFICSSIFLSL